MTKRTVENDRLVDWLKIDNLPDNTNQDIVDLDTRITQNTSDTAQVQTNLDNHESNTTNPHSVTKAQVGLGNVDNTSDNSKPVSTATQTALDTKQDTSEKGVANWYAGLDWTGKVPSSQLPDAGLWDMTKTTYDPQGIEADAFSMDNMVEGTDTKILTEAERIKLASVEANAQENTINDVVAGTNITIDKTDPLNPIFNASWWIAPVDSVNWETGVVVLDTDDIWEGTNKYVSQSDKDKLAWIEDNADVTDSTNVDSAGAVMESDYSQAKSILAQQSGTWSPEVVQVGSNELVGRTSGGTSNIGSLSASEVRTILNIEDGATADQTASEIKTAYESNADTNVFTDSEKTNLGNQSGTNTWDQDLSWLEPAFTKNTAFNKDFGTTAWTVLEGSKDALYVKLAGAQTITGEKTFTQRTEFKWATNATSWEIRLTDGSTFLRWLLLSSPNESQSPWLAQINIVNTNSDLWIWTRDYNNQIYIKGTTGNVWIGTTSPFQKAHIAESTNARMIIQETTWATWATSELLFQTSATENFAKWAIVWEDTWLAWARWKLHLAVNNSSWAVNAWLSDSKLTINNDGNVWIGTISPEAKSHVRTSTVTGTGYIAEADSIIEGAEWLLELASNRDWSYASGVALTSTNGTLYNNWAIINGGTSASWRLRFLYGNTQANSISSIATEFMSVTTAGNVWIGTTSPWSKLEVSDSSNTTIGVTNTWTWESRFDMKSSNNTCRLFYRKSDGDFGIFMPNQDWTGSKTRFRINWDNWWIILDGNVWIGTISPWERLDVNWRIALSQTTAPTVASWKAVQWVASGSGTKDGTAYDAGDVLWTSNTWWVSKTLIILNHSEI